MRWLIFLLAINVSAQVDITSGVKLRNGVKSVSTIAATPPPFVPTQENMYCKAGDIVTNLASDGPAQPLQKCIYTAMSATPSPGLVITVASDCSNLQSTINSAACGSTIVIPATAVCSIAITLPNNCNTGNWTTIRTDQISNPNFPAEGTRATPCEINITHIDGYPDFPCTTPGVRMPTLQVSGTNSRVIQANSGASHYRLIGLNITKPIGTAGGSALVQLDLSDHIILDRVLIHGVDWSSATKLDTHIGISTRGTYQAIINSWCYDIDWNQPDGQCIAGGTGAQQDEGPLKIYNNLLAGSSETWEFGGGAAASVPHDFEIRYNLSMKPLKWMFSQGATSYNISPNVKNLGEWKQGDRVLMEYNAFMNVWEGQSDQYGSALLMMPKSQSYFVTDSATKFVNVNGNNVSCASDATGTPCAAGTGIWGNAITSIARTNGFVTLRGVTTNGWPYYNPGYHIWLQGIPSQVVNGVNLNTLNGEWTLGCSDATDTTCTDGYNVPGVMYFKAAGADFPQTTTTGLATDAVVQTCANAGHCHFDAPRINYPTNLIMSVIDSEHITVKTAYAAANGLTFKSCHQGQTPNAEGFDYTIRYNYITHSENIGFTLGNVVSECGDAASGLGRVSIHDNVADDIDTTSWVRGVGGCCGHGGAGPDITNGVNGVTPPHDITFAHNTWAGQRGWAAPVGWFALAGYSFSDAFNANHNGTTVQRISNVVSITYPNLSGDALGTSAIVSGFTGTYASINGTWPVTLATDTQVIFTQSGSNPDINPAVSISSGTTGAAVVNYPLSYYANVTWRDNIFISPIKSGNYGASQMSGGLVQGLATNFCQSGVCTWTVKNNLMGTALYPGYTQGNGAPYPTTNPDASATNFILVPSFSTVFTNWNTGLGNTVGNDYHVTATYQGAGSDGKDIGADISKVGPVITGVPHFTYYPLTISTTSLTACTNGTYCEQQLLTSSSASQPTANGFVKWTLVSGTLPAGMTLSNGEGYSTCQVNGAYSKTGPTGCQGWLWGTPTTPGSYPMTFQVEDGAHQKATKALTLTVN